MVDTRRKNPVVKLGFVGFSNESSAAETRTMALARPNASKSAPAAPARVSTEELYRKVHQFLKDCVAMSDQPEFLGEGGANACSYIVQGCSEEQIATTLQDWAEDIVRSHHCELRLNGAGLKLDSTLHGTDGSPELFMHVGGDQADFYPQFVAWANGLIAELGLCREWHKPKAI
jgi:hypothetical protein